MMAATNMASMVAIVAVTVMVVVIISGSFLLRWLMGHGLGGIGSSLPRASCSHHMRHRGQNQIGQHGSQPAISEGWDCVRAHQNNLLVYNLVE